MNHDKNMNPEDMPVDKPDNDINSGKSPEKYGTSEIASGERTEYKESATTEGFGEIIMTDISDESKPSGIANNSEVPDGAEFAKKMESSKPEGEINISEMPEKEGQAENSEESELSGTAKEPEKSNEQEFTELPVDPEITEGNEQNKISDDKNTIQYKENNEASEYDEDNKSSDDAGAADKTLIPEISEEPKTTDDNKIQTKPDYQTEITDKLSPEEKERINKYKKFKKVDGSTYRRVNQFLRKHTYITAREWAIARLCADFSTRGGAEMTFIGENLPELIPFMTDTYSPQAVNQARSSFKKKVKKSGATFFYGALCGFFTADELDDILFESSEVARFLLEIEGTSVDLDDEIDIEDKITDVMRSVAEASSMIRAPKTVSDEPEDNFEYEDIPEEKIPEECYSDLEELTEDLAAGDEQKISEE